VFQQPELIVEYEMEIKARSSQKKNATINSLLASGIPSRPSPLDQCYKFPLAKPELSLTDPKTLKVSKFGKRTLGSLTTPMGTTNQPPLSDKDKST
jgi:hypothetical protein